MELYLVCEGLNPTLKSHPLKNFNREIAHSNVLGQPVIDQLLHCTPGIQNINRLNLDFGNRQPIAFDARLRDESDRPMDQKEVDVGKFEARERFQQSGFHQFWLMIEIVEFGRNENDVALDLAFRENPGKSAADRAFGSVTGGCVNATIACNFDRINNRVFELGLVFGERRPQANAWESGSRETDRTVRTEPGSI
jgi:hypothetical protein